MMSEVRWWGVVATLVPVVAGALVAGAGEPASKGKPAEKTEPQKLTYQQHVRPILREKCFACHNPDKKRGDLDMTTFTGLMEGGGSGEVIVPGNSEDSYLYQLVSHEDEPYMPPDSDRLPDEMLAVIKAWIDGGALEHSGSKVAEQKATPQLAMAASTMEKPETAPLPEALPVQPVVQTRRANAVTALATSPWAPLAAVSGPHEVLLYHTKSLQLLGVLPYPEGLAHVLRFSPDGQLLLAGGGHAAASGQVVVWEVKTGQRVLEVGDELDVVLAADITADRSLIALGGPQRVLRVYATQSGALAYEFRKHTDWVYAAAFSPDGVLLATADRSGGLWVLEAQSGHQYLDLRGHKGPVTGLAWRADANVLASCSEDGTIRLWEMEDGKQLKSWRAHAGGVASIFFTRDGRIVSCGRDRRTVIWDQNGKGQRALPQVPDLPLRVAWCHETGRVLTGDWTGTVHLWDGATGNPVGKLVTNLPAPVAKK